MFLHVTYFHVRVGSHLRSNALCQQTAIFNCYHTKQEYELGFVLEIGIGYTHVVSWWDVLACS